MCRKLSHCREGSAHYEMCAGARSESGLPGGKAASVRKGDVSGVSKTAARAKCEAAAMPGSCMEGTVACDSATRPPLSVPSVKSPFSKLQYFRPPPSLGGDGPTIKYRAFRARSVERGGAGKKPAE